MSQGREQTRPVNLGLAGEEPDAPTQQLGLSAAGDRCAACGTPLASDQRYCVNCGERRGKPRFTLAEPAGTVETKVTTVRPPRGPRPSYAVTLIAGIATLLLAMGVGVLIGHNSAGSGAQRNASAPVKIDLGGSGASTPEASGSAASGGSNATGKSKAHGKAARSNTPKAAAAKPTKAVAAKASAAANKVLGGASTVVAPATVTQGQACSGAGCSGGKFNGNFFGGG